MIDKEKAIIFVAHKQNGWLTRIAALISHLQNEIGMTVELCDIEKISYPSYGLHGWQSKLRAMYGQELVIHNVRGRGHRDSSLNSSCCNHLAEISADSTLMTSWRETNSVNSPTLKRVYKSKLIRSFWRIHDALDPMLQSLPEDTLFVVPNGRLSHEVAVLAALDHSKKPRRRFYEVSLDKNFMYFGKTPPLNRQGRRRHLDVEPTKRENLLALEWLEKRVLGASDQNIFASRFSADASGREQFDMVLFTSSADEFESFGQEWASKKDQNQAFTEICDRVLSTRDYSIAVRIHPNLGNKSVRTFISEAKASRMLAKRLGAELIGPFSSRSSYQLINESKLVAVYGSTVGLEAIYMGKETWIGGAPFYVDELSSEASWSDGILQIPSGVQEIAISYVSRVFKADLEIPPEIQKSINDSSTVKRISGVLSAGPLYLAFYLRLRVGTIINQYILSPFFFGRS